MMRGRRRIVALRRAVVVTLAAGALMAAPSQADACGILMKAPTGPSAVREALHLAHSQRAEDRAEAVRVIGVNAELGALDLSSFADPSTMRARLVLVQLIVRSNGELGPRDKAKDNLTLAGELIRLLEEEWGALDPRMRLWRALHAEAAGILPPRSVQLALELLAAQGLMTHAAGWAALARFRGTGELAEQATDRCWAMSFDPQKECTVGMAPTS